MNHGVTAVGRHWCATEIQNAFNATDRQITTILIAIVFFFCYFFLCFFSQTSHLYLEIELFVVVVFVIIVLQVL